MNDYGFDYLNYITNVPSNMKMGSNMNYMSNNMSNTSPKIVAMKPVQVLEPYQGFIRGNSFQNEYVPYKNYKPAELNPSNEREALYYQLLQYKFMLKDLNLYLDTHPNDREILELYQKYLEIEKQIQDKYESMYGPLTTDSKYLDKNSWNWLDRPWPWEGV